LLSQRVNEPIQHVEELGPVAVLHETSSTVRPNDAAICIRVICHLAGMRETHFSSVHPVAITAGR
jgi:hypothetical protein